MASYHRRRWNWALSRSLEAIGWKGMPAFLAKFIAVVVAGIAGFYLAPSPDLATRAITALLCAVIGGLVALGSVLLFFWLIAPSAMDAEREAELQALRAKLGASEDQYPLPAPYGIIRTSATRMLEYLKGEKASISITIDSNANEALNLYRQVVAIFRDAGWDVSDDEILGLSTTPESGVSLLRRSGVPDHVMELVRKALYLGGIDFYERTIEGDDTVPQIAFSRRDPLWVPPAKWG